MTRSAVAAVARPQSALDSATRPAHAVLSPRGIARLATRALWDELALYPKPGLVSLHDAGAHSDMDASTFVRSLFALRGHFRAIAAAGASAAPFDELRILGHRAEAAMLRATGGVNTHRGAIFALGLLGAAATFAGLRGETLTDERLRSALVATWCAALQEPVFGREPLSHGMEVAKRYGTRGARGEAQAAFPSVFEVALPALREARGRGVDIRRARIAAFFALLESVEDTNILYRAGSAGLEYVRSSARRFRAAGGADAADAFARAEAIHSDFVVRRLSPGGCADLLAATLFVDALQAAH
jgi:triphosphoribosyl-dephospho-CoA synthase